MDQNAAAVVSSASVGVTAARFTHESAVVSRAARAGSEGGRRGSSGSRKRRERYAAVYDRITTPVDRTAG